MSKNVLLTGGAGFIGHHTVEHILLNTDWNIIVMDRLTYAGNLNRLVDMKCWRTEKKRVAFVYHDFRSDVHDGILPTMDINYIIHMGAESHVDRSIANPGIFAESNIIGTISMLNLARRVETLEKFVYISTDEVYGPSVNGHLHVEGEPHLPGNPYSASKAGAEAFVLAYHNTYGLPAIITNTMNNFGERQDPEKFVPKVVKSILTEERVPLHVKKDSNNKVVDISSRCWLHARNHADALLFLMTRDVLLGQRYNITGDKMNVVDMSLLIQEIIIGHMKNHKHRLVYELVDFHSFRPGHDMHYGLDGSKMAKLGWTAPLGLVDSLERTIEWMCDPKNRRWLGLPQEEK